MSASYVLCVRFAATELAAKTAYYDKYTPGKQGQLRPQMLRHAAVYVDTFRLLNFCKSLPSLRARSPPKILPDPPQEK